MKRIGILSDTHGCWDNRFEDIAPVVRAVSGNIDHGMVRRKCRELEIFSVEGVKVLLTHIGGYPGRYAPGVIQHLRGLGVNLMVTGHSHILRVMFDRQLDLLHINPGAAGVHGWQKERTLIRLTIDGSDMSDLEVVQLGKIKI